jgi:hypothetical protein
MRSPIVQGVVLALLMAGCATWGYGLMLRVLQ